MDLWVSQRQVDVDWNLTGGRFMNMDRLNITVASPNDATPSQDLHASITGYQSHSSVSICNCLIAARYTRSNIVMNLYQQRTIPPTPIATTRKFCLDVKNVRLKITYILDLIETNVNTIFAPSFISGRGGIQLLLNVNLLNVNIITQDDNYLRNIHLDMYGILGHLSGRIVPVTRNIKIFSSGGMNGTTKCITLKHPHRNGSLLIKHLPITEQLLNTILILARFGYVTDLQLEECGDFFNGTIMDLYALNFIRHFKVDIRWNQRAAIIRDIGFCYCGYYKFEYVDSVTGSRKGTKVMVLGGKSAEDDQILLEVIESRYYRDDPTAQ